AGNVLDILGQRRRDKRAAKKFFHKLLQGLTYISRVIGTDKLQSYGAAQRELRPGVEQRQHRSLNKRAENSPQPPRPRERRMQWFKSPGPAQRLLSAVRSCSTSGSADIGWWRPRLGKREGNESRSGARSPSQP
ncbi:MAG TPA: DDE-type integrase/transposase/recombinase, partial [Candidatus Binatia bacterium]|nr:DDE-type integrase/transposase/recombinase [Candidatus Binatia bacterium]